MWLACSYERLKAESRGHIFMLATFAVITCVHFSERYPTINQHRCWATGGLGASAHPIALLQFARMPARAAGTSSHATSLSQTRPQTQGTANMRASQSHLLLPVLKRPTL